jgi:hypothetical protein
MTIHVAERARSVSGRYLALAGAVLVMSTLACSRPGELEAVVPTQTAIAITATPAIITSAEPAVEIVQAGEANDIVDLSIFNDTDAAMCYLYIAAITQEDWGPEQLGTGNVIPVGGEYTIANIPAGQYDLLAQDCEYNVLSWTYAASLTADSTMTISTAPNILIVDNQSSVRICELFISSANSDRWGRGHLIENQPIEAGHERTFALQPGIWDLRALTCGGKELLRYGEDIRGTRTWTITD